MIEYILTIIFAGLWIYEVVKREKTRLDYDVRLKKEREEAINRSRASLEGRIYEQLVPILPEWPYVPSDAKFIGNPIDFFVFKGLSTGVVEELVIVEIKRGKGTVTRVQKQIRKLIEEGKVRWEVIKL